MLIFDREDPAGNCPGRIRRHRPRRVRTAGQEFVGQGLIAERRTRTAERLIDTP